MGTTNDENNPELSPQNKQAPLSKHETVSFLFSERVYRE